MSGAFRLLIPLSVHELALPHINVLNTLGIDPDDLMETCMYSWPLRDDPGTLYDELCTQMYNDANSEEFDMTLRESFDDYHFAVTDVIDKIRPHMLGLDLPAPVNPLGQEGLEYAKYCGGEEEERLSFFIAELHFVD